MIYYKKKIQQNIGATAIEYGLIASLIGVSAVSGMSSVGVNLSNTYCTVSKHLGGSGNCSSAKSSGSSMTPASGALVTDFGDAVKGTLVNFAINGITTISGYYDANGHELTTPKQLANYVGVSDDLYNRMTNAFDPSNNSSTGQEEADVQNAVHDAVEASGKQYYDNASDVTLTDSGGNKYTYRPSTAFEKGEFGLGEKFYDSQVYVSGSPGNTREVNLYTSKATGD